jgi:MFS family permease
MRFALEYARRLGSFQRNARLYLINNALSGVTAGIVLVLYNLYLYSLGYAADFVGFVLFAVTIGAGIAIFPAGICVDRFSGKGILIGSNLLIALAGIGQFLFRQPVPLLVSGFVEGVAFAFILVINAPFLTRNSSPRERTALFSMNISLGLITLVAGEVLGGVLPIWFRSLRWLMAPLPAWAAPILASQSDPRSYQLSLLFAGLIAAPSLIPLFLLREETRAAQAPSPHIPTSPAPTAGGREGTRATIDRMKGLLRSPFFFLMVVYVFTGLGAGLFIPYFNIFFVRHLRASSALFGVIDGGANGLTALTTLAAPWLAARIGRVHTIALTRLLSIPLLLMVGLTGILPLAALLYPLRQGMMDMSNGVLQVYSMEVVAERYRGVANSSYQAAFQVSWAITASLGGIVIVQFGYAPIFLLGAACYMLAIAILWGRFRYTKGNIPGRV